MTTRAITNGMTPAEQGERAARYQPKTYPVQRADGRIVRVTIPDEPRTDAAIACAIDVLTDLVVGHDQGGREVTDAFILRARQALDLLRREY